MPDTPAAQPVEGQDPGQTLDPTTAAPAASSTAPTPVAPAPPAAAPVSSDSPWSKDLATTFTDEAQRAQVDQFLRETVQPYVTQQEQKASEAGDAIKLWNDFGESPLDTYAAVTKELFGDEIAGQLLGTLQAQIAENPTQAPAPQAPDAGQLDPRLAAAVEYVENQQANQFYEGEISRITTDHPEVDSDLFHPFVAAAEGDFDEAYRLYTEFLSGYAERHGGEQAPADPPPQVSGSDTTTAQPSNTPVEPKQQTIGEAIEEFVTEQHTAPAPPVGTA